MAICGQSLLNAYQWTYYINIIFYWKLINSVKLGLKTYITWYICKKSQNFLHKAINLAYFTENNENCESKFNLQLCSYGQFGYGQ